MPTEVPEDSHTGSGWITFWVTTVYRLCDGTSYVRSWELSSPFQAQVWSSISEKEDMISSVLIPLSSRSYPSFYIASFRSREW